MKILYIIPEELGGTHQGGVTSYTMNIAGQLGQAHSVTILTPGSQCREYPIGKIRVVNLSYNNRKLPLQRVWQKFPWFIDTLRWSLCVAGFYSRHGPFDIVESSEWGASTLFISLMHKGHICVRIHKSLLQFYQDNRLKINLDIYLVNLLEMLSILFAGGVSAPSEYILRSHNLLSRLLHLRGVPVAIIRNGIELPSLNRFRRKPCLLAVGRLEKSKGTDVLLDAFLQIYKKYPHIKLVLIGEIDQSDEGATGNISHRLSTLMQDRHMKTRIYVPGYMSSAKLDQYYRSALLCINPSVGGENQPMAILEAISYGKAIVATRAGGIPEVVQSGVSGLLVPPENPTALAEAIVSLLDNPSAIRAFERHNSMYRRVFDIRKTALMTLKFYKKIS